MGTGQETHRAGHLKQSNKAHKTGRHRSKGSISSAVKGKISVKALTKKAKKDLGKEARRHQSQQLRAKKREEVIASKRNLGGSSAPPVLITIIPLQEDFDVKNLLSIITSADETAEVSNSPQGLTHIAIPRFKQRFSFVVPPIGNTFATLDAAKVSTTILFVSSVALTESGDQKSELIDSWGEEILNATLAQGLPTTIVAITDLESIPVKKRQDVKQSAQESISKWLPEDKILPLDKPADALNLLRKAGSQKQRNVVYRNRRPHLIAEKVKFSGTEDPHTGTLEISGYIRGKPLSVNSLIHIPGFGDFQMSQIDASDDPYPLEKSRKHGDEVKMSETRVLEVADPTKQESLQSENIPDPMDAEQTWPTEEEMAEAAEAQKKKKLVKIVPKGTSEYQAAWIPDEDGEILSDEDEEEEEEEDEDMKMAEDEESDVEGEKDDEEFETMTVSEAPPDHLKYDEQIDFYEEKEAMQKIKEAKSDAQFPDEVDTPHDIPARTRFQKYRGLESFRTSPWDVKENLPYDYSRIFQFQNFERTRKRILQESEDTEGALAGWYVTLHVKNVSRTIFEAFCTLGDRPLIVFGLLPNENKMSLLNVVLKSNDLPSPVRSKETLIFQCGYRRFTAAPVFSQHTNAAKHKFVRFLQPDDTVVASMFAPIIFPPCPVICYKEMKNGSLQVVGRGSVLNCEPNRLVIKRVVLSGHPFKVHKRSAVVRFMFFNREDIHWFKPVALRTKYGRRGHIKEPLGTHGHMKCVFDGQLKSQDTILLNLYKRVFPKWTYEPCLITSETNSDQMMAE